MNETILIVDDEDSIRRVLKVALEKKGYEVHTASSGEDALTALSETPYLLIFSDIFMEGMSGLEFLNNAKETRPEIPIVMMTAQDTMNNTIEAMRLGAYDYISKPFDLNEIYSLVQRIAETRQIERPQGEQESTPKNMGGAIVGKSKKMQEIFKIIGKSAESGLPALITGESGSGKELVAHALHQFSQRTEQPFIGINCAAISRELLESELFGHEKGSFTGASETKEGKFELAEGGSLFLDEIGDMEPALQAKILRVLQDKEYYRVGGKTPLRANVRILAATNQNLLEMIAQKRFREDLYHRLNVVNIHLPPLRERREDILLLAQHFIDSFAPELTRGPVYLSPEAEQLIQNHIWPGNIRELENVCKSAMVLASSGPILKEHLPQSLTETGSAESSFDLVWEDKLHALVKDYLVVNRRRHDGRLHEDLIQLTEKQLFKILLSEFSGKQIAAAKALGINRNTLKKKIDALDLEARSRKTQQDK
ncbi:MAG: sigma-54-dependent Fis family transcriptional regulator [Candidatus Nitrohelix vancouverensis]|uniref:DNA-binding transcriptional regulator NtrC n=1 Tax=Candidatus Nitrohelix vancouverensis TaxID=2705534 RepID=A0A7T0G3H2_9BACT|nr:MAG: sigma-54-dependent Fis family transcriptional regulator [Candidatus Nitrohelix vancouverensis]